MATRTVSLEGCPVESCDLDVAMAIVTNEGTKLTTMNLNQARTCLYPTSLTVEGEDVAGSYIVYHDSLDATVTAADDDAAADADTLDVDDLPSKKRRLYDQLREATTAEESISRSALKGKCGDMDMSPEYIDESLDSLQEAGYVVAPSEGHVAPVV